MIRELFDHLITTCRHFGDGDPGGPTHFVADDVQAALQIPSPIMAWYPADILMMTLDGGATVSLVNRVVVLGLVLFGESDLAEKVRDWLCARVFSQIVAGKFVETPLSECELAGSSECAACQWHPSLEDLTSAALREAFQGVAS